MTPKKPKAQQAPAGTPENPRVGQPGPNKPKATTKRVSTKKGFGSFKPTESGERKYQEAKAKIENRRRKPKAKAQSKPEDDQDDTDVKSNRLEKVKTAVKNTGKKLVRGAGYLGGLAVRGAKAVGRELGLVS